jgi:hypothetical protein
MKNLQETIYSYFEKVRSFLWVIIQLIQNVNNSFMDQR